MPERLRVGVLASGRGSNFEALVKAVEAGALPVVMAVLISDRGAAPALDIARANGLPWHQRNLNLGRTLVIPLLESSKTAST